MPSYNLARTFQDRATTLHGKTPGLRVLPSRAVAIIIFLILVNIIVWIAAGIVFHYNTALASTGVLAWVLGLRHALDADHIAAIDLMTRRLLASGQKPVTVGTFFSLGHSTIVVITSIVVAATSAAVSERFDSFSRVGGIIGSSVSAAFLVLLGCMNIYILVKLVRQLRILIHSDPSASAIAHYSFEGGGCLFALFKRLFRLIDKPWKMYPLGILFGLGFDTSSEIALLGISSIEAAKGTSIWLILIFPVLFTAGMCLLDTIDGALMMSLYTSATMARDSIAILYYSIVLTSVTVVVALFIGIVQALVLADAVVQPEDPLSPFWAGVEALGDSYDIVGGSICGLFVIAGGLSIVLYKPWRRRVDRKQRASTFGGIELVDVIANVDESLETPFVQQVTHNATEKT